MSVSDMEESGCALSPYFFCTPVVTRYLLIYWTPKNNLMIERTGNRDCMTVIKNLNTYQCIYDRVSKPQAHVGMEVQVEFESTPTLELPLICPWLICP